MTDKSAERKQTIFTVALGLFSERGIKATSMQDIAERCGFSKGTLYQHFRSKEELIRSIHEYALGTLAGKLDAAAAVERPARETFREQAELLLHSLIEFKEFIIMQIREREFSGFGEDLQPGSGPGSACGPAADRGPMHTAFVRIRGSLIGIYGPEIDRYSGDLSLIVSGLMFTYPQLTDWGMAEIPVAEAVRHLEHTLDAAAERLLRLAEEPLIAPDLWAGWVADAPEAQSTAERPVMLIRQMRETLSWSPLGPAERLEAAETLDILEEELTSDSPRRAVVKGMLSNLREVHSLSGPLEQLGLMLYRLDVLPAH
ncbi:helix-turn-helix domain-containing protein [Saccharibacillus sp. CPCC 101409]|uniref:TetR/AcrR family transcriptional regulator n=1 Tax=Saccharibacillus sp. CPCC 101409 TaxID=3058041 RepID=UPI0026714CD1|nr:TetR/AcrR family transcriptional regulator [Saccharibacillus sp. CPCC 101409]MDO3412146.1 helix-turn-helix domain-containing protein [Saccharibacillus sp. CPCC 101409]